MKHALLSLLLLFVPTSVGALAAQDISLIPPDMLELDFQQCRRDCLTNADEGTCDFLCNCSTKESFPKVMSFERYLTFRQQITNGSLTPDMQQMLDQIGKACFDRFRETGRKIGPPARPKALDDGSSGNR